MAAAKSAMHTAQQRRAIDLLLVEEGLEKTILGGGGAEGKNCSITEHVVMASAMARGELQ